MESESFVVLASRSPRRVELLKQLVTDFTVLPADIDETPSAIVIGADTTVDLDGHIFGQPVDDNDARQMLRRLSGTTHQVHTGVAVVSASGEAVEVVSSSVTFLDLRPEMLEWYIGTGESVGKAGSYAIQGHGSALVASSVGSMSNIIGLPLDETARLLGVPAPK